MRTLARSRRAYQRKQGTGDSGPGERGDDVSVECKVVALAHGHGGSHGKKVAGKQGCPLELDDKMLRDAKAATGGDCDAARAPAPLSCKVEDEHDEEDDERRSIEKCAWDACEMLAVAGGFKRDHRYDGCRRYEEDVSTDADGMWHDSILLVEPIEKRTTQDGYDATDERGGRVDADGRCIRPADAHDAPGGNEDLGSEEGERPKDGRRMDAMFRLPFVPDGCCHGDDK